ncbi:TetR/AcrR family transcriptional regulator [Conexibacter sp. SYSU D00693]|uniref:TetR/AcrR family transcriptional regulator n=1 Tax=Conexibacter sp. SYSU D00693 TaxID=2812560 RepID=UPI00196B6AED|nr:TetR/AcrR family transcriptional regulator [Conexibacter sp. SYSU D00693]
MGTPDRTRQGSRRQREEDIVAATRALFDERGAQDAPVEEVARALGLNRALIYRHFASREELYVRTVTTYLDELAALLRGAAAAHQDPADALEALCGAFAEFGLDHPAFPDAALSLMRRPADELRDVVSDGTWLRLGQSMGACLGTSARVLRAGMLSGAFAVDDPDLTANVLYAQGLGTLHIARLGVGVKEIQPGMATAFPITRDEVREAIVDAALALVGVRRAARAG